MTENSNDPIVAPPGLHNVIVADTELGDVRGQQGFYHYRQYDACELARRCSLEQVAHLMLDGALPDSQQERHLFDELAAARAIPGELAGVLPTIAKAGPDRQTIARLRSALSILGAVEGFEASWGAPQERLRSELIRMIAVTPTLQAAIWRLRNGLEPVEPRDDLSAAENWLWLLHGTEPEPAVAEALNSYLVATVDHGFNASTFTARVIASAGADVASAITGALGTFAGPLHGGAPDRALDALDEIGTPDGAARWVHDKVAGGERIMGFGHAVYRTADPRATLMRDVACSLADSGAAAIDADRARALVDFALEVERDVDATLAELKPGRELHANVEFYAGVVMELCGVPRELFTPTFANARVIGWAANVLEQCRGTKLFRPIARYTGPQAPQPLP